MIEETKEKDEVQFDEQHLRQLLENLETDNFREEYLALHPYDQAQFYEKVGPDIRQIIYQYLSPKEMADIFEAIELDDDEYKGILEEMDTTYAAQMIAAMYTDDAVDVLNELDKDQITHFLKIMDKDSAQDIKELLYYAEYTAGSIMTTEYVAIPENSTVRSAMTILRNAAPDAETIYYIFVVDDTNHLTGVISLRDLIIAEEDTLIRQIMNDRVVSINVTDDQEAVAQIMKDYNFLAVPVINSKNEMLGIITVDDIIDVIDEEASDDYSKLAGVSDMVTFDKSPFAAAKKRLPWLVVLLFLGMLTANLVDLFTGTLEKVAILAAFIPLIGGTSGNSGTQALAVAVRGIATGDVEEESKMKLLIREAITGIITGVVCGVIAFGIVFFWKHMWLLGLLVGTAICCSIIVATIAGSFIPLLMHRLKIDPAVASGPFITTLNDITSILIYLGIATMFISKLM
ncbi:magnesium transporter [Viridibacillus sp. FSL E2-0187]|uniref:Magnesium transporter MgtE n=1 Tax=Viridibacillus arvi TaxID=263475 RepID=A0A0M0LF21_9BACL|nr:magnesium transporter [Viridibacillus arvi]KOO49546.1 magnesium transporter MgtE [Viridibacillus arvi]